MDWQNDGEEIKKYKNAKGKLAARPQNTQWYFKEGLTWNKISTNKFAVKYKSPGYIFDDTSRSAFPEKKDWLFYYIGLLCSKVSLEYLKALNPTMSFTNGDLVRIPIIENTAKKASVDHLVRENIDASTIDWDSLKLRGISKLTPHCIQIRCRIC